MKSVLLKFSIGFSDSNSFLSSVLKELFIEIVLDFFFLPKIILLLGLFFISSVILTSTETVLLLFSTTFSTKTFFLVSFKVTMKCLDFFFQQKENL